MLEVSRATVRRGLLGYSAEQILVLEQMLEKGVMALSDVKMRRVQENT